MRRLGCARHFHRASLLSLRPNAVPHLGDRYDCRFLWNNQGYRDLRPLPRRFPHRQAQEDPARTAQGGRRRHREFRTLAGEPSTPSLAHDLHLLRAHVPAQPQRARPQRRSSRRPPRAAPPARDRQARRARETLIAAAIFFQGGGWLYGRYWGASDPRIRCTSRPAITRASNTASSTGCRASIRERRASTRSRGDSSRRARVRLTGWSMPASGGRGTLPAARTGRRRRVHRGCRGAPAIPAWRGMSVAPLIPWLRAEDPPDAFPPVENALTNPTACSASGGDLRPERLLAAYRRGIFPWYSEGQPILWWSPDPRVVLFPGAQSRAVWARRCATAGFASLRHAFRGGDRAVCRDPPRPHEGTWISPAMRGVLRAAPAGLRALRRGWEDDASSAASTACARRRLLRRVDVLHRSPTPRRSPCGSWSSCATGTSS